MQLEFKYLSKASGNPAYANAAQKAMDYLDALKKPFPGLYPVFISNNGPSFTMGACAADTSSSTARSATARPFR